MLERRATDRILFPFFPDRLGGRGWAVDAVLSLSRSSARMAGDCSNFISFCIFFHFVRIVFGVGAELSMRGDSEMLMLRSLFHFDLIVVCLAWHGVPVAFAVSLWSDGHSPSPCMCSLNCS